MLQINSSIDFQLIQREMCQYIRQARQDQHSIYSYEFERLQVYQSLIRNNIHSFLDRVFPITQVLLSDEQWQALCEDFICYAQCQSPFFNDISLEFQQYLQQREHPFTQQFLWLTELLQFEWLELFVELSNDDVTQKITQSSAWRLQQPYWILVYQYPVFSWTIETRLEHIKVQPAAILAWRDQQHHFCVSVIEPWEAFVLEQVELETLRTQQLAEKLYTQSSVFNEKSSLAYVQKLHLKLQQLHLLK